MRPTAVLSSFVVAASVSVARASCGTASCPADMSSAGPARAGTLELGYEFEFIPQDKLRIHGHPASPGQIRGHHDEHYTINRLHRLRAAWEIDERFRLELRLPYVFRNHAHVHHHGGADVFESWSLHGVSDLELEGRWAFHRPEDERRPRLSAIGGLKFPTGERGLRNESGDEADPPFQPGSGSTDVFFGFGWLQRFAAPALFGKGERPLPFHLSVIYRVPGRGIDRYRKGDSVQGSAGVVYPVSRRLGAVAQLNALRTAKDDKGRTREETDKTGAISWYGSPGLELQATDSWRLYGLVQFPIYRWVHRIQLAADYNLLVGTAYRFALR